MYNPCFKKDKLPVYLRKMKKTFHPDSSEAMDNLQKIMIASNHSPTSIKAFLNKKQNPTCSLRWNFFKNKLLYPIHKTDLC